MLSKGYPRDDIIAEETETKLSLGIYTNLLGLVAFSICIVLQSPRSIEADGVGVATFSPNALCPTMDNTALVFVILIHSQ